MAVSRKHMIRLSVQFLLKAVFPNRDLQTEFPLTKVFGNGTSSGHGKRSPISSCFGPNIRHAHRLTALLSASEVMSEPAVCGPETLAFCQNVQARSPALPPSFFDEKTWRRRLRPGSAAFVRAAKTHAMKNTENQKFSCINPLRRCTGGPSFHNLFTTRTPSPTDTPPPKPLFSSAEATSVATIANRDAARPCVFVLETGPYTSTPSQQRLIKIGASASSSRNSFTKARAAFETTKKTQRAA